MKTHKIAAMVFWFVFLCLFWWFKARESDVFKKKGRTRSKVEKENKACN